MIRFLTLRDFVRVGTLGAALTLLACTGDESGLPPVTFLSPEDANHGYVNWSPDGNWVTFWEPTPSGWDVVLARADLSGRRVLTSWARVPPTIPPIAWSPDGTLLAYAAIAATGMTDVWVLPLAEGEPRRVTEAPGWEAPTQWHPNGDRLAVLELLAGGVLWQRVVWLESGASEPFPRPAGTDWWFGSWSPDGSRIGYGARDGAGLTTIWLADSAGENARQLTTEGFEELALLPWSPDGTELLYVSRRTGAGDVFVFPINQDSPRQLTRDVRQDRTPRWSPDGQWVTFISERGRQTDMWIVPAAGGTELRVTDDEVVEQYLAWAGPDRVTFTKLTRTNALWTVSLGDGSERQLTPDSIDVVGAYDISNDGTQIALMVQRGGGVQDLAVVPVAGGPVRTLVADGSWHWSPRWSPDGDAIAFLSNRSGNYDVWVVDAAGGTPRQLTDWASRELGPPEWTADGSGVYFRSPRDARTSFDLWVVPALGGEPTRLTTVGTVTNVVASPYGPDVFVSTWGGPDGRIVLNRVLPDGGLQVLWDRTNVLDLWRHGVMPSGDSIVIDAARPDGTAGSVLVPVHGGEGRWLLDELETASGWSSDGTLLVYGVGEGNRDIAVLSLSDGSKRSLTETTTWDGVPRFAAGDEQIVFRRSTVRRRIVTADVSKLMEGGN